MQSHNFFHIIDFQTRMTKDSSSALDNIFIDYSRINSFQVFSLISRLFDHEAQYLCVNNILNRQTGNFRLVKKTLITKSAMSTFTEMLESNPGIIFINHSDVNTRFNLFLNTFLIILDSCFPMQYVTNNTTNNIWITKGINISCKHKTFLYIMSKTTNCSKIKTRYIRYLLTYILHGAESFLRS